MQRDLFGNDPDFYKAALVRRLEDATVTLMIEERRYLANLVKGEPKRAAHRPSSQDTEDRYNHIAFRVALLEREGKSRKTAIDDACEYFGCRRSTVRFSMRHHTFREGYRIRKGYSLRWARPRKSP